VERGERNVSPINIVKIARGLNVRPAKLIEPIRWIRTANLKCTPCIDYAAPYR
jgi:hypothetical protein